MRGEQVSLVISLMTSASGWSNPCGPTREDRGAMDVGDDFRSNPLQVGERVSSTKASTRL